MKILALDTASEICSVAVSIEGEVFEKQVGGRRHAECLLGLIEQILAESGTSLSQMDAIAFGRGPGMFTGLRIGAGVTQGLAYAASLPVIPVSSLASLAQAVDSDKVLAVFDARMGQVYWGLYQRNAQGLVEIMCTERVDTPENINPPKGKWLGAGSGWDQYNERLLTHLKHSVASWEAGRFPSARAIARLGEYGMQQGLIVSPEQAIPVYVRDEVARKSSAKQPVSE